MNLEVSIALLCDHQSALKTDPPAKNRTEVGGTLAQLLAYARFKPTWQRVPKTSPGTDALPQTPISTKIMHKLLSQFLSVIQKLKEGDTHLRRARRSISGGPHLCAPSSNFKQELLPEVGSGRSDVWEFKRQKPNLF